MTVSLGTRVAQGGGIQWSNVIRKAEKEEGSQAGPVRWEGGTQIILLPAHGVVGQGTWHRSLTPSGTGCKTWAVRHLLCSAFLPAHGS